MEQLGPLDTDLLRVATVENSRKFHVQLTEEIFVQKRQDIRVDVYRPDTSTEPLASAAE